MFTVKVVDGDHESVREATHVEYIPAGSKAGVYDMQQARVEAHLFDLEGHSNIVVFTTGIIYVMNNAGNTVSKYFLNDPTDPATK